MDEVKADAETADEAGGEAEDEDEDEEGGPAFELELE